jgi:hypothetical protein
MPDDWTMIFTDVVYENRDGLFRQMTPAEHECLVAWRQAHADFAVSESFRLVAQARRGDGR